MNHPVTVQRSNQEKSSRRREVYVPKPPRMVWPALGLALLISLGIFSILPLTQLLSAGKRELLTLRQVEIVLPAPPPPPVQPPPPEEKQDQPKPELEQNFEPLSLSQLEIALHPGTGGALQGDFDLNFAGAPDTAAELRIFELSELDRKPMPDHNPKPDYPDALNRIRLSGVVQLTFVVDEIGRVQDIRAESATHVEFEKEAIATIAKWRFTPGTKDGAPVPCRMRLPIRFNPPQ